MCSGVNLIKNHLCLFIFLLLIVALLLILGIHLPLLRIFGFGPKGPVKSNEIHLYSVSRSLTTLGFRICCCMGTGKCY